MKLRDLWSVLAFAAAAAGFLIASRPLSKEALAAVGFALIGAAITRLVDVMQERARNQAAARERRRTDLDETRRLAYMMLLGRLPGGPPEYTDLMATLANALAHHGRQVPYEQALHHLGQVLDAEPESGEGRRWLQEQIDRITAELDAEVER